MDYEMKKMTETTVTDRIEQIANEICKRVRIVPNNPISIREFEAGNFSVLLISFAESRDQLRLLVHRANAGEYLIVSMTMVSQVFCDFPGTLQHHKSYEDLRNAFAGTIVPVLQEGADFAAFMKDFEHFSPKLQELLDGSAPPRIAAHTRIAA